MGQIHNCSALQLLHSSSQILKQSVSQDESASTLPVVALQEHDVQRRPPALIERVQPQPDRLGECQQDADEQEDQEPALECHDTAPLEAFGADQHRHEIDEKADCGQRR